MTDFPPDDERVVAEQADFPPTDAERGPVDLSGLTLHCVGHAHIDLGYRWNMAETVHRIAPWTFAGVLDLMDRTPGFTFCQSQLALYEWVRANYPELFARIRTAIDEGRWEVIGGGWCEYDAILPGGESVIRQHLHGVRYAEEVFGVREHRVAFVPDSFCGHAATLPQILAGCGFEYYVFGRGLPADPDRPEATRRAFRWRGPDGSSLVACLPFGPYATPPLTAEFMEGYKPYVEAAVSDQELVLYGQGDHGGGPRDAEIESLRALDGAPQAPAWRYSTVHELCAAAFDADTVAGLGVHDGGLGGFATGALTSQAPFKRRHRRLEGDLLAAEAAAVIGSLLSRKPAYPRVEVRGLWRELLVQQFHDILPGTSVASVYRDGDAVFDRVEAGADALLTDAFDRLRSRLDTRDPGGRIAVIAFNPGLQPVQVVARATVPATLGPRLAGGAWRLENTDGSTVRAHFDGDALAFPVDLGPLGYGARWLVLDAAGGSAQATPVGAPADAAPPMPAATFDGSVLDNGHCRLAFDPDTGDVTSLRMGDRERLSGTGNVLDLRPEQPFATAWVQAYTGERVTLELVESPHVVDSTPLSTTVRTVSRSTWSRFVRDVTLHHDTDGVDFRLAVDWHEGNAFLKLGFDLAATTDRVRARLAHGSTEIADPEREFCAHQWVALEGAEGGLALLDDGAYGCDLSDRRLGLSVVRTVRDMDPAMAHGPLELRYALATWDGPLRESALERQVASFDNRVCAAFEPDHPGGLKPWGSYDTSQSLPPSDAFVGVDCDHVELCAFKMPDDDWLPMSFLVRLRETDGEPATCAVTLPVPARAAQETDHLERTAGPPPSGRSLPCDGRQVRVRLAPRQIMTLRVEV